jgi:hypothetical protein
MSELRIIKGSTFRDTLRWATSRQILIDARLFPEAQLRIEAPGHNIPDGWQVRIEGVEGIPPYAWHVVCVVDADNLLVKNFNGETLRRHHHHHHEGTPPAYPGIHAVLRWNTPVDLNGYGARMQIRGHGIPWNPQDDPPHCHYPHFPAMHRDKPVLLELSTDALAGEPGIQIDVDGFRIVREIPADVTAALRWRRGEYDLEMFNGDYVVKIDSGEVFVSDEVTR